MRRCKTCMTAYMTREYVLESLALGFMPIDDNVEIRLKNFESFERH